MDPWTLAYLAGHRDMSITKRYVHPQAETVRAAIERERTVENMPVKVSEVQGWAQYWAQCQKRRNRTGR
jgi:hypothetical protein